MGKRAPHLLAPATTMTPIASLESGGVATCPVPPTCLPVQDPGSHHPPYHRTVHRTAYCTVDSARRGWVGTYSSSSSSVDAEDRRRSIITCSASTSSAVGSAVSADRCRHFARRISRARLDLWMIAVPEPPRARARPRRRRQRSSSDPRRSQRQDRGSRTRRLVTPGCLHCRCAGPTARAGLFAVPRMWSWELWVWGRPGFGWQPHLRSRRPCWTWLAPGHWGCSVLGGLGWERFEGGGCGGARQRILF